MTTDFDGMKDQVKAAARRIQDQIEEVINDVKTAKTMDELDRAAHNVQKLRDGIQQNRIDMAEHWARFFSAPWNVHAYVNLFVESRRADPYLLGHLDAVLYPILIGAAVWGWLV